MKSFNINGLFNKNLICWLTNMPSWPLFICCLNQKTEDCYSDSALLGHIAKKWTLAWMLEILIFYDKICEIKALWFKKTLKRWTNIAFICLIKPNLGHLTVEGSMNGNFSREVVRNMICVDRTIFYPINWKSELW